MHWSPIPTALVGGQETISVLGITKGAWGRREGSRRWWGDEAAKPQLFLQDAASGRQELHGAEPPALPWLSLPSQPSGESDIYTPCLMECQEP